jgi:hypothetical protein
MYNEKTFRRSMAAEFYSFAEPGWWGWVTLAWLVMSPHLMFQQLINVSPAVISF